VAITPPSDIVLGVALAADPEKYRAAAERLKRLSATVSAAVDRAAWQPSVVPEKAPNAAVAPNANAASATISPPAAGQPRRAGSAPDAFGQLEAFVLQTFIQSMLPKNASHVFGKGTAGEVWKSMLAEKLANEIARSGHVGLAKRLVAVQASKVAGATAPILQARPAQLPASLTTVLPYLRQPPPERS
jgi:flagellar protein FlgJ